MADQTKQKATLIAGIARLEERIIEQEAELERLKARLQDLGGSETASAVVRRHIRLLHDYNEIKDIGLGFLAVIAESQGLPLMDVHKMYGINDKD